MLKTCSNVISMQVHENRLCGRSSWWITCTRSQLFPSSRNCRRLARPISLSRSGKNWSCLVSPRFHALRFLLVFQFQQKVLIHLWWDGFSIEGVIVHWWVHWVGWLYVLRSIFIRAWQWIEPILEMMAKAAGEVLNQVTAWDYLFSASTSWNVLVFMLSRKMCILWLYPANLSGCLAWPGKSARI